MISEKELAKILKSQGANPTEMTFTQSKLLEGKYNEKCMGFYLLSVQEWKGVKTNLNNVAIPVLKLSDTLFVNSFYVKGEFSKYIKNKKIPEKVAINYLDDAVQYFETEANNFYSVDEINEIRQYFLKGLQIFPKGRLRN